jgi:hypothetical protein
MAHIIERINPDAALSKKTGIPVKYSGTYYLKTNEKE